MALLVGAAISSLSSPPLGQITILSELKMPGGTDGRGNKVITGDVPHREAATQV